MRPPHMMRSRDPIHVNDGFATAVTDALPRPRRPVTGG